MFPPDVLDQFFITQRMTTRHSFPSDKRCCMSLPRGNRQLQLDFDFKDSFLPLISLSHFNSRLLFRIVNMIKRKGEI